jgi:hypothetical protein
MLAGGDAKPRFGQELVVLRKNLNVCSRTVTAVTLDQPAQGYAVANVMH